MERICILILLAFSFVSSLHAQQSEEATSILSYLQKAMNFNKVVPQEKVYLHFDNTAYFLEETIWSGSGGTKDLYTICGIGKEECGLLHNGDS